MMRNRNKLPIYQLIFMPRSTSTNGSSQLEVMMTWSKNVFLLFYDFNICKALFEYSNHSASIVKRLTRYYYKTQTKITMK